MAILKITVSGSFRSNGKIIDYTDMEMTMPECDEGWIQSHALNRIFTPVAEAKFNIHVDSVVTMYIEKIEKIETVKAKVQVPVKEKQEVEEEVMENGKPKKVKKTIEVDVFKEEEKDVPAKPLCCGKKIKSLNWDEIQHFAIMYNLIAVPLPKATDLRTAREIAYREFMIHIKGSKSDKFDYAAAPDMTIPDVAEKTAEIKSNAKEVLEGDDLIGEEKTEDKANSSLETQAHWLRA